MEKHHIMEQFASLARFSTEEAWAYSALGDAAIRQVEQSLRDDVVPDIAALEYLCAALCFYRFSLLEECGENSVRAQDVTVTKKSSDRSSRAVRIRDDALVLAKNYLKDEYFFFRRTD